MFLRTVGAALGSLVASVALVQAQEWTPSGPITLLIGFAAGGGADTQARIIAEEVSERTGWTIIPQQAEGRGGLILADQLKDEPADGTVIGMVASEVLTYNLIASGSDMTLADFTPLVTTASFEMGLVGSAASGWEDFGDVIEASNNGQTIRFGAITDRLGDLAYVTGLETGVDFNIVEVAGGAAVINGIMAGDLDVGFVAGAQSPGVKAGDLVNLASAMTTSLALSPDAPLLSEFGLPFVAEGYFMFAAPAALDPQAREAISTAVAEVIQDSETRSHQLLQRSFDGPAVLMGEELEQFLARDTENAAGLFQAARD